MDSSDTLRPPGASNDSFKVQDIGIDLTQVPILSQVAEFGRDGNCIARDILRSLIVCFTIKEDGSVLLRVTSRNGVIIDIDRFIEDQTPSFRISEPRRNMNRYYPFRSLGSIDLYNALDQLFSEIETRIELIKGFS